MPVVEYPETPDETPRIESAIVDPEILEVDAGGHGGHVADMS